MRRKIVILLALLMLLPSGVLADVAVNGTGGAALIASDGAQIIPAGVYSRIFPLKEGFWGAVEPDGKCVLLNGAGEPVSDARFDELRCVRRTLLYREGGAWGILSDNGTPLVQARYSDIRVNGEGDFIALRNAVGTGTAQSVDFLDADGRETAVGVRVLYGLEDYSQGYMPVLFAKSGLYGYLDTQGVVAFEGQYIAAGPFSDGYAVVTTQEGTGMIDRTGRVAVPMKYRDILRFGDVALLSELDGSALVLRIGGDELLRVEGNAYIAVDGNHGVIRTEEETLLIDRTGKVAGRFAPSVNIAAGESGQIIISDGLWGEAGTYAALPDGTPVSEMYQMIQPLEEGMYAAGRFDAQCVADEQGNVRRWEWDAQSMRFALMDDSGVLRSEFVYTMLRPAGEGMFFAQTEEKCGLIDAAGTWVWTAPAGFMEK